MTVEARKQSDRQPDYSIIIGHHPLGRRGLLGSAVKAVNLCGKWYKVVFWPSLISFPEVVDLPEYHFLPLV